MTQPLPISGFRVIDHSHFLAGPYLVRSLAGMGAEFVKDDMITDGMLYAESVVADLKEL